MYFAFREHRSPGTFNLTGTGPDTQKRHVSLQCVLSIMYRHYDATTVRLHLILDGSRYAASSRGGGGDTLLVAHRSICGCRTLHCHARVCCRLAH